jgi:hypothetical protein
MRTDELKRLLTEALHEGDALPVDAATAERRLAERESERLSAGRRWSVALAAAGLVGLLVLASLALGARLVQDEGTRPIGPAPAPRFERSPSGLPVGLLEGKVARSDGNVDVSTFRLQVLADGTGGLSMGGAAHGNAGGGGGGRVGYPVDIDPVSEGRAVLRYEGPVCSDPRALTLTFSIRGRNVVVDAAAASGCLVNAELVADLPGTVLRAVSAQ